MDLRKLRRAVGAEVCRLRVGLGLQAQEFAPRLWLSHCQLSRLQAGKIGLRLEVLARAARALGVRPSAILAAAEASLKLGPRPRPAPPLPEKVTHAEYGRRLGRAVRRLRVARGLTGRVFSKGAAMSQPQLSRLESGVEGLRFAAFCRLAEALKLRPSELLAAGEPEPADKR